VLVLQNTYTCWAFLQHIIFLCTRAHGTLERNTRMSNPWINTQPVMSRLVLNIWWQRKINNTKHKWYCPQHSNQEQNALVCSNSAVNKINGQDDTNDLPRTFLFFGHNYYLHWDMVLYNTLSSRRQNTICYGRPAYE